jgi:hypothetical protein
MAYLQTAEGKFEYANESVFGRPDVRLSALSRKVVAADFNNDGRTDLAYALNQEDGRDVADASTVLARSAVMLSQADGKYRIDILGSPDWFHSVEAVRNPAGYSDVVFAGFSGRRSQAFRHANGTWVPMGDDYPAVSASTFRASADGKTIISDMGNLPTGNSASVIKHEFLGGAWTKTSEYFVEGFSIPFITYSKTPSTAFAVRVGTEVHVGAGYEESCFLRLDPATTVYVSKKNSQILPSGYQSGSVVTENIDEMVRTLDAFEFKGVLRPLPSIIDEEDRKAIFNDFRCVDVNADGYDDIVVSRLNSSEGVVVYLNNRQGRLVKMARSAYPGLSNEDAYRNSSGLYEDLTGDGIPDLLIWTLDASQPALLYRGARLMSQP